MLELEGPLGIMDRWWYFAAKKKDQRGKMSRTQSKSFVRNTVQLLSHVSGVKPRARSSPSQASPQNRPIIGIIYKNKSVLQMK